jgi:glyoxylase-like metal-dependent hydrolase (beta-lactamase superfamily II)
VASARFAHTLAAREPYYLNALQREFGIQLTHVAVVYPTISVDRSLDLDLGDRVLTLQAWPTAHTDNDLTVYDRRTRTLFASDLLFRQHLPALDGSLRGWISVMAEMKRLDVASVIPGHGPVSDDWPAVMDEQADYLNGLLRGTRAAIRNRLTIQQAIDSIGVPPASRWLLTDRFHRRNVTAAYAELEWEDDNPGAIAAPASAGGSALPERPGGG